MFTTSRPIALLEHFRTPHEPVEDLVREDIDLLRARERVLAWPRLRPDREAVAATLRLGNGRSIPVIAPVASDAEVASILSGLGGSWLRDCALEDRTGAQLGSTWRREDGSVLLPFDPDAVLHNYLSESYLPVVSGGTSRRFKRPLMTAYYRLRPLLPRALQIWFRRHLGRLQARSRFPRWPVETGLHDFFDYIFAILADVAGEPVPRIAPWPDGHSWAFVLTHDVEHAEGLAAIDPILELERAHGMRSSWNLVPRRYTVEAEQVRQLVEDGFEVGVHGLYHDGRDLESLAMVQERGPAMREAAQRWGAIGFRAPATHRHWDLMPLLGFSYDTSSPDTDPFEPMGGGCCTWLPFFNGNLVELPLTLTQDHTLFVILRRQDEQAWVEKTEFLRAHGGMALIDTHPDYLVDQRILAAYGSFIARYAGDGSAWKALPREVSEWWRRRAASTLSWNGTEWSVVGPAADEGRVELFAPDHESFTLARD